MKKILLALAMMLFVFSCGTPQAQKDLESVLKALQTGDVKKIKELNPNSEMSANDETVKIFLSGYKKMSYKIKKTKVEGDKAIVNLDIKAPDLSSYFPEFMQQGIALAFSNFGKSEEEMKKLGEEFTTKYFEEKLKAKDLKFNEKNIDVVLKKNSKNWQVDGQDEKNKELLDIITFGFSKLADNMNGTSEQKQPTKYFKKGERGVIERTAQTITDVKVVKKGEYSQPKEGNEYVVIKLTKENISNSIVQGGGLDYYQIETKDKKLIKPDAGIVEFGQFNFDDIPIGNKVDQTIVFEVPKGQVGTFNIIENGHKLAVYDIGF